MVGTMYSSRFSRLDVTGPALVRWISRLDVTGPALVRCVCLGSVDWTSQDQHWSDVCVLVQSTGRHRTSIGPMYSSWFHRLAVIGPTSARLSFPCQGRAYAVDSALSRLKPSSHSLGIVIVSLGYTSHYSNPRHKRRQSDLSPGDGVCSSYTKGNPTLHTQFPRCLNEPPGSQIQYRMLWSSMIVIN